MSYHRFSIIQGRAVGDTRVSDSQLRTLSAIGMYADKDGWCWPSQSTIAEDTGKTRKTINEHIASLCELGYLEKHWVENGDKSQMKYRLLFDTLPETQPLSSPEYSPLEFPGGYTNDPLNDPLNVNTASGQNQPSAVPLSIENQIYVGSKVTKLPDDNENEYRDNANLLAMSFGINAELAYSIAYTFMTTRKIVIPQSKIKGQRKAVKEMIEGNVLPSHVAQAVKQLLANNMTVADLFSISKTAISLANPAPSDGKPKKIQGQYVSPKTGL